MATAPEEMHDLSRIPGALLINFGTITNKDSMILAGKYANEAQKPLVFDPVGVGATQFRKTTASELLNAWQASVIKGNAGEMAALANSKEVCIYVIHILLLRELGKFYYFFAGAG